MSKASICVLNLSEGQRVVLRGDDVPSSPDVIVRLFKRRKEKRRSPEALTELKQRLAGLRKARQERTL